MWRSSRLDETERLPDCPSPCPSLALPSSHPQTTSRPPNARHSRNSSFDGSEFHRHGSTHHGGHSPLRNYAPTVLPSIDGAKYVNIGRENRRTVHWKRGNPHARTYTHGSSVCSWEVPYKLEPFTVSAKHASKELLASSSSARRIGRARDK